MPSRDEMLASVVGSALLKAGTGLGRSTHEIGLTSSDDLTDEVAALARAAYRQQG